VIKKSINQINIVDHFLAKNFINVKNTMQQIYCKPFEGTVSQDFDDLFMYLSYSSEVFIPIAPLPPSSHYHVKCLA
jgi:hypothetical protein